MAIDIEDLDRRLKKMEDIYEIQKLQATYSRYINDCEFDKVHTLFTEDGINDTSYMTSKPCIGREEIRQSMARIRERLSQVKQFIHNHTIEEVDGDTARGWQMMEARYGRGATPYNVAAKFQQIYQRVDGRWLIKKQWVRLYFTVPHDGTWSGPDRHVLAPDHLGVPRDYDSPNPAWE